MQTFLIKWPKIKRLNREIERLKGISDKTAYNLFSIFIEFLSSRVEPGFDAETLDNYINKLKHILGITVILYDDLEISIDEQLFWMFARLDWFYDASGLLKRCYLKLLSSKDNDVRERTWEQIPDLIGSGVFKTEEITALKEQFLDLLKSSDEKVRSYSWSSWSIYNLIKYYIIKAEEVIPLKDRFFELLQSMQEDVRTSAWGSILYNDNLLRTNIITRDDHNIFLGLLQMSDEK